MDLVKVLSEQQLKSDLPTLKIGDTVKVRRAKLYYLRGRVGKAAKIAEKV